MTHEDVMRIAMEEAEVAVRQGQAPFGAVVVDHEGTVIAQDHDRVHELLDPTAHAEINAIRLLCKKLNTLDLSNCIFYCTSEPCPTCMTSCIKARVRSIYYGAETEVTASLPIKAIYFATQ